MKENKKNKNRVKAKPVDPFLNKQTIDAVCKHLRDTSRYGKRNEMLIRVGCSFGLRASDLCRLRLGDVRNKKYLDIVEKKTKKRRIIYINKTAKDALNEYLKDFILYDDDYYLFPSQKSGHVTEIYIWEIIKKATRQMGLEGNYGSHTLRKTTAYQIMQKNASDSDIKEKIRLMLGHTSQATTDRYLTSSVVMDNLYKSLDM